MTIAEFKTEGTPIYGSYLCKEGCRIAVIKCVKIDQYIFCQQLELEYVASGRQIGPHYNNALFLRLNLKAFNFL